MLEADRYELSQCLWAPRDLEDPLSVSLRVAEAYTFALLVELAQIKDVNFVIITHVGTGQVLSICTQANG